jgi:NADH-quinone oxidoreductase subunit C
MADAQDIENNPTIRRLKGWDPHAVAEAILFRGELTLLIPREHLVRIAEFVRSDAELRFNFLSDITAVDRFPIEPRFELNYHLLSIERRERLRLKIRVQGKDPVVASVTSVWPTANWHEREAFDLFGVRFEGHPDLQRIFMPDDWEGYPLRKDYPVEGYR